MRQKCVWPLVGGIYTVIKTKAAVTVREYGDRYCLMGPYRHRKSEIEVEESEPSCPLIARAVSKMRASGVHIISGRWLVEGSPNLLLFDVASVSHRLNEWKADLWEKGGIPTHVDDIEVHDAVLFGYMLAWFFGEASPISTFPSLPAESSPQTCDANTYLTLPLWGISSVPIHTIQGASDNTLS